MSLLKGIRSAPREMSIRRSRARHARARLASSCPEREPAQPARPRASGKRRVARARSAPASAKRAKREMGRAGIEPATLGLKVRPNELRPAAPDCTLLQFERLAAAENCSETQPLETSLYAHLYSHLASGETTPPRRSETERPLGGTGPGTIDAVGNTVRGASIQTSRPSQADEGRPSIGVRPDLSALAAANDRRRPKVWA
jgi:hypothetical protein